MRPETYSCAGCKKDTPHDAALVFHHGPYGDVFHLCAECDAEVTRAAKKEIAELKGRVEWQTDWYQQRFNRLRRWVNEEVEPLSTEVAHRYFSICANGSPAPHESADWTETMHELKLRLEQAEQRVKTLTAERDHFKAMLRERADSLLEAREEAEKQALEFRAIAKSIDAAQEVSDPEIEYLTAEDVGTGDATSETTPHDQIREYADEIKSLKLALRNIQMYAQKNRHRTTHVYEEEILRFCAEAGVKTEILREDE